MNSFLLVCDVFLFVFWENPRPEKNVSKSTDLYKGFCVPPYYVFGNLSALSIYLEVLALSYNTGSKSCQVCHVADALDKVGAFPENVRSKAPRGSKVMAPSYGLRGQP